MQSRLQLLLAVLLIVPACSRGGGGGGGGGPVTPGFIDGDTIPGFVLSNPSGGRADIRAQGSYASGTWTVMLTRGLLTPDKTDDVQIDLTGTQLHPFGVAVLDNASGNVGTMAGQDGTNAYTLGGPMSAASLVAVNETPSGPVVGGTGFTGTPMSTFPLNPATVASVTLYAAYDVVNIYLLAVWTDMTTTESDQKQRWEYAAGAWTRTTGATNDEDRLAIFWRVDATVPTFDTLGCNVLCNAARHGTSSLDDHMDLWHWKAHRTNSLGFAEDQRLANGSWGGGAILSGRSNDTETGFESANTDGGAPALPLFMAEDDPSSNASFLFLVLPPGARRAIPFSR